MDQIIPEITGPLMGMRHIGLWFVMTLVFGFVSWLTLAVPNEVAANTGGGPVVFVPWIPVILMGGSVYIMIAPWL